MEVLYNPSFSIFKQPEGTYSHFFLSRGKTGALAHWISFPQKHGWKLIELGFEPTPKQAAIWSTPLYHTAFYNFSGWVKQGGKSGKINEISAKWRHHFKAEVIANMNGGLWWLNRSGMGAWWQERMILSTRVSSFCSGNINVQGGQIAAVLQKLLCSFLNWRSASIMGKSKWKGQASGISL